MPFEKGKSGNPNGRPPKHRALTDLLEKAGRSTMKDVDGKSRARNRVVSRVIWELISTRTAEMPDGKGGKQTIAPIGFREWFEIVQWAYKHIDGPAPTGIDIDLGGGPFTLAFNETIVERPGEDDDGPASVED